LSIRRESIEKSENKELRLLPILYNR